jgi:hypothetical protein
MHDDSRIMDLEVNPNYFLAGFYNNKGNIDYFEVIDTPELQLNQLEELYQYMSNKQFIGYNVLEYDALVLEKIFDCIDNGIIPTNSDIYEISQDVVNAGRPFKWEWQLRHKWLDLLQMNHWGVKSAKTASLKWLQFSTDQNILDLPYKYDQTLTLSQIKEVRDYCLYSDIPATKKIYELCKPQQQLRATVGKDEDLNLMNAPEPKIARELFSKHLSKEMGITKKELKELKTLDVPFKGKDVLLDYIKFEDPLLIKLHEDFKNVRLFEDSKFKRNFNWNGLKIDVGLGGVHATRTSKIYEATADTLIYSSDVVSYYPNLAIRNKKGPRHLGESFTALYEGYFNKRRSIPKKNPMNYVLKIVLNSAYGLTLDKYSFLFDRQLGMFITLNGQLLLLMLMEKLSKIGQVITMNTDGLETIINKDKESEYLDICKWWEELTSLELEHEKYKKYVAFDINNYISITESGKSKCKGRFEFQPMLEKDVNVLHKNKSELIVAKAIHDHFVYNIPIEKTILEHDNIFDFCIGERSQWDSHFEDISITNGELIRKKLPKTIRYYISNKGGIFKKVYDDGREQFCVVHPQKGRSYNQTLFNKIELKPISEYDIDYNYYLKQARKEINVFNSDQLQII